MKNKLLSCVLAAALAFSLAAHPAAAATFPDIETHWAKDNIEQMAQRGLFNGYEDGSFRPDHLIVTSEALALCARIAVNEETRAQIGRDRADEMDRLLGGKLSWFRNDFATCLELDIISYDALHLILLTGQDQVPMQKAEFALYLTRAMGLGDLAEGLSNIRLTYADADAVPARYLPYIYLLTLHGVLNGTDKNEVEPLSFLNRAVAATMIGRVLEARDNLSISIELPRYTTYNWVAGYITDVTAGNNGETWITVDGMQGNKNIALVADGTVYLNNMPTKRSDLKVGAYARLILNAAGRADAVRLISADWLVTDSGAVTALTQASITVGGTAYAVNRFTAFTAGGRSGDWSIVDPGADYSSAECITDGRGNALSVVLKGGTRAVVGLLAAVEVNAVTGVKTITVAGFDGRQQRYPLSAATPVTSGGVDYNLRADTATGTYVTLQVNNEELTQVASVTLDFLSKYVQGSLNSVNTADRTVNITELPGSRNGSYPVDENCEITFSDSPVTFQSLKSGNFVTARLQGGQIVALSVWPGEVETTGKLVSITYGDSTVLHVQTESGVVEQFSIALTDLSGITITRNNATAGISSLSTGDTVSMLVRFHELVRITATARDADVTGTVSEISFNAGGASITLTLSDGSTAIYTAASGITVMQDGSVVPLSNIKPGVTLAAVTSGNQIISAEIKEAALSNTKLEGQIYLRESSGRRLTLIINDGAGSRLVVVNIPYDITTIMDTLEGPISVNRLAVGDRLQVWGAYDKQEFTATAVVREH